jgi:TBC domain-containing protein kinase-like protein
MKFAQIARKILSFCRGGGSMVEKIAREHGCVEKLASVDAKLKALLDACLSPTSCNRPTAEEITKNEFFLQHRETIQFKVKQKSVVEMSALERFENIDQIYYLWQLAGGDVQVELKKEGLIRCEPPILTIPRLVMLQQGKAFPIHKSQSTLFDQRIVILNTNNLSDR